MLATLPNGSMLHNTQVTSLKFAQHYLNSRRPDINYEKTVIFGERSDLKSHVL